MPDGPEARSHPAITEREHMGYFSAEYLKFFRNLARNNRKKYGTLQGEKNKVLPAEFKEIAKRQPLIANKQFYYMAELPAETILKNHLTDTLMQYYHAGKAMNDFLTSAMRK